MDHFLQTMPLKPYFAAVGNWLHTENRSSIEISRLFQSFTSWAPFFTTKTYTLQFVKRNAIESTLKAKTSIYNLQFTSGPTVSSHRPQSLNGFSLSRLQREGRNAKAKDFCCKTVALLSTNLHKVCLQIFRLERFPLDSNRIAFKRVRSVLTQFS